MTTVSLRKVIEDNVPLKAVKAKIYVIRDRKAIFYVGKSNADIIDRVRSHFGYGRRFPGYFDPLRQLMLDNHPFFGKD